MSALSFDYVRMRATCILCQGPKGTVLFLQQFFSRRHLNLLNEPNIGLI